MTQTQAFSVDWSVTITTETNAGTPVTNSVSRDVVEAVITKREGGPNAATVVLDTSERPHLVETESELEVQLRDGNRTIDFAGRVDAVKDSKTDPTVTIDAREAAGRLDDVSAVGRISEYNLGGVIEALITESAGQLRDWDVDEFALYRQDTLSNSTVFGTVDIDHSGTFDQNEDDFDSQEDTDGAGKPPGLYIDDYENTTGVTYEAVLTGEDGNGDTVEARIDLPPGDDAYDAFGQSSLKLSVSGGTGKVASLSSISTDIPDLTEDGQTVSMNATVKNYVKTDWDFRVEDNQSVRDALELILGYISTLDDAADWGYRVESGIARSPEIVIQKKDDGDDADRYVFTEGDNVLRPVANRSLDGVYNMVKVDGAGDTNVWLWAYDDVFYYSPVNPFDSGDFPNPPDEGYGTGISGGVNDIDQIDLRARPINAPNVNDVYQAKALGEETLQQLYRTPVSGVAEVPGLHPASPGDEAEIYYPSRGIPAKVTDNVYTVKSVEYQIDTNKATTKVDWGISEPKTGDLIAGDGLGTAVRGDLSSSVQQNLQPTDSTSDTSGTFPLVGTIKAVNDDGTYEVQGEDGNNYSNVDVI